MIPYGKRLINLRGNKSQSEVAKDIGVAASTLGIAKVSAYRRARCTAGLKASKLRSGNGTTDMRFWKTITW